MYGQEMKTIRLSYGYTQTEIAKATGIPQNTISWIEANKGLANIQQCVQLADFYGITLDELIGRDFKNISKSTTQNTYTNNGTHNGNVNF